MLRAVSCSCCTVVLYRHSVLYQLQRYRYSVAGLGSCIVGYTAKSCNDCCIVARRAHHTQSMGAALCWCLLGLGETPEGVYGVPELWRGVGMHDVTDPCPSKGSRKSSL